MKAKQLALALLLTSVFAVNAQNSIVKATEATTEETTTEKTLPWNDKLFLYRYDTRYSTLGAYDVIGVHVFYDKFQEDENGDWYVEFTSQSDAYQYFLYTSKDDTLEMYTEDGTVEIDGEEVPVERGEYKNLTKVYNPQYLVIPSTTPDGKEEHSLTYPYKIENCFSNALDPIKGGGLNYNLNNWTASTKFVRGVKYRFILHLNEARDNATMEIKRLDWDNYVEGRTDRKFIYFDNSETQWDNVYACDYFYANAYKKVDDSYVIKDAEKGYFGYLFTFKKLGDTDIWFCDLSGLTTTYEITNLVFMDTTAFNPYAQSFLSYENKSLEYGLFNEALYSKEKIYNYATAYVPKPTVTRESGSSMCTFTSPTSGSYSSKTEKGVDLYYKVMPYSTSSRVKATDSDSNLADLDGWTYGGTDSFEIDLSTVLDNSHKLCVKAVSGIDDGAESEMVNVAYVNNVFTGVENIDAEDNEAVEYYNLQGVKIAAPVKGQITIEKRGNSVRKIQ